MADVNLNKNQAKKAWEHLKHWYGWKLGDLKADGLDLVGALDEYFKRRDYIARSLVHYKQEAEKFRIATERLAHELDSFGCCNDSGTCDKHDCECENCWIEWGCKK